MHPALGLTTSWLDSHQPPLGWTHISHHWAGLTSASHISPSSLAVPLSLDTPFSLTYLPLPPPPPPPPPLPHLCILLNIVRRFIELWFDSSYHSQAWSCSRMVSIADKRLLSIQPPSSITRAPRSLTERKYWTGLDSHQPPLLAGHQQSSAIPQQSSCSFLFYSR